ncbi:MAG: hypothetical protein JST30_10405 [Armatimonadetes bacterium]|nr:hypothetical protein [Armatimonadota bacterium]
MSRRVVFGGSGASGFTETLSTIEDDVLVSGRRSGSARLQANAQAIFDKARESGLAEGREAGRQLGFEEGYVEGTERAGADFEREHSARLLEFSEALEGVVEHVRKAVEGWYAAAESSLQTLAVEIARRAIAQELGQSRESVLDITRQALAEIRHGTSVRIRLNPVDCSILESRRMDVLGAAANVDGLEVVADPSVLAGCVIETTGGTIDATVEGYLDRVEREAA